MNTLPSLCNGALVLAEDSKYRLKMREMSSKSLTYVWSSGESPVSLSGPVAEYTRLLCKQKEEKKGGERGGQERSSGLASKDDVFAY